MLFKGSQTQSQALLQAAWKVAHWAVQHNPNYIRDHASIASTYEKSGQRLAGYGLMAESKDAYLRAVQFNHSDVRLYLRLAGALASMGALVEASEVYSTVIHLLPDNPAVHFNYAELLLALNKSPEAKDEMLTSLKLHEQQLGKQHPRTVDIAKRLHSLWGPGRPGTDFDPRPS